MKTIDDILSDVLGDDGGEGGDAALRTAKFRYAKGLGLDADGIHDDEKDGVKLVTADAARKLLRKEFYQDPKIDTLPDVVQALMFDFAVSSGIGRAVITLQEVLDKIRQVRPEVGYRFVEADGAIGASTRDAAAAAVALLGGEDLTNQVASAREAYLRRQTISSGTPMDSDILRCRSFRSDIG